MNKDVISITPEDDITDVIAQIKASEKKIVAIIPPQPAGILRSVVNIKLIAKVSEEAEKVPVLVTSDPAVLKLAHEIRIPVAEDLNSRPHVPTLEGLKKHASSEDEKAEIAEDFVAPIKKDKDEEEDDEEKEEKKKKSDKKSKKDKKKKVSKLAQKFPWIAGKEKIILAVAILIVLLVGFLVWALVIAPFVDIYIKVSVNNENNFSQSVTFTEDENAEDVSAGKFYLQTATKDFKQRMNFTATGKKDLGDTASGEVSVALFFDDDYEEDGATVKIPSGTQFSLGELKYVSTKEVIFGYDEETECENLEGLSGNTAKRALKDEGCQVTKTIPISASEPGEKYNIDETKDTWSVALNKETIVGYAIFNAGKITGGTSKIVTIVLQSDVDKVKGDLSNITETDGKNELFESISDSNIILDTTFKAEEPTFEVAPAVGEEVKEGTTPVVVATRQFSVNTIDVARIEEFIKDNIKLPEDQKIYSYGEKYIEYFSKTDDGYSGKLKTTYKTGPNISEDIIFDKIAGRKVGDAQSIIRSIQGIDSYDVKIDTSILLNTVPTEKERVKITIDFKE
ncbi:hypothetical protein IKG45_00475 [Candidatus Saccharibacteria bacterium]|nr:hypothetical protein [Candidatus Saccharibacteria bacterium]